MLHFIQGGIINGSMLALELMGKGYGGNGGVIINTGSDTGILLKPSFVSVSLRRLPIQFKTYLYRSDFILVTRTWDISGAVKILKQGAASCFRVLSSRKAPVFYYKPPKFFKNRTVRMLLTSS
jgi:hypothetical protein